MQIASHVVIYVCMCTFIHTYIHTYIHKYITYVHIHTYIVHKYVYIHIRIYIHTYVRTYIQMICMCRYRKIAGDVCMEGVSENFLPPSDCGKCVCVYSVYSTYRDLFKHQNLRNMAFEYHVTTEICIIVCGRIKGNR